MWTFTNHSRRLALSLVQLESVISERTAELQDLSQRLLKVQDEERRRLARDLHDSTGQTLAALKISVTFLQEKCKQDPSMLEISSEIAVLADQAIVEIRTMSYLLHPPLLDEVGFACAAEWYVDGFAKRSGIRVHLNLATGCERLPTGIEMALFRVLQEGLTNVHRHSGASQVRVHFQNQTERAILEIRDFGRGIPSGQLARLRGGGQAGVGLAGMRERLRELNGQLEIESDSTGTNVRATVPHHAIARLAPAGDCGRVTESTCAGGYA
jgi:two-component system, NarL family, sensor kinase